MKITQTPNRMEIYINGVSSILFGLVMVFVGSFVAYYSFHRSELWPIVIEFIFVITGLPLIFLAKNKSIIIEKGAMTTIFVQNVIFRSSKQKSIPTTDIVGVTLVSRMYSNKMANGDDTVKRISTLFLLLKNNDLIMITKKVQSNQEESSFFGLIVKSPLSRDAEQIAKFLGVPLKVNQI